MTSEQKFILSLIAVLFFALCVIGVLDTYRAVNAPSCEEAAR